MSSPDSVCNTQDSFNDAFKKAVKYTNKKNTPSKTVQLIIFLIAIALIFWALMLASRVNVPSDQKVMHFVLALVFSPVYIISYYLSNY